MKKSDKKIEKETKGPQTLKYIGNDGGASGKATVFCLSGPGLNRGFFCLRPSAKDQGIT